MRKIRIAQIGTSLYSHGEGIFKNLRRFSDDFEVVGYALPENEREKFPERMGVFGDLPELTVERILNDPTIDAVAVETEEVYLLKYAQMVANAGKHIHMEKPGSQSLADFQRLVATVKEKNLVFHIGYMYRYNPLVIDLLAQNHLRLHQILGAEGVDIVTLGGVDQAFTGIDCGVQTHGGTVSGQNALLAAAGGKVQEPFAVKLDIVLFTVAAQSAAVVHIRQHIHQSNGLG